jgi:hypothetical protein
VSWWFSNVGLNLLKLHVLSTGPEHRVRFVFSFSNREAFSKRSSLLWS